MHIIQTGATSHICARKPCLTLDARVTRQGMSAAQTATEHYLADTARQALHRQHMGALPVGAPRSCRGRNLAGLLADYSMCANTVHACAQGPRAAW
jgi:hypothetical protein